MRNNTKKVSIIISVLNAATLIEQCLISVFQQDYPFYELIVIDGGSKDGTVEIIEKYSERVSIFISELDTGIYNAWNKGIAHATGNWISFIGSDDRYISSESLSSIMEFTDSPEVNYVCSQALKVDNNNKIFHKEGKAWDLNTIGSGMRISHPGSLHRRDLFEKFGMFNEAFRIAADYDFLLRCSLNIKAAYMPKPLLLVGNEGISNSRALLCLKESKKALANNIQFGPFKASKFFLIAYMKYYFRKFTAF